MASRMLSTQLSVAIAMFITTLGCSSENGKKFDKNSEKIEKNEDVGQKSFDEDQSANENEKSDNTSETMALFIGKWNVCNDRIMHRVEIDQTGKLVFEQNIYSKENCSGSLVETNVNIQIEYNIDLDQMFVRKPKVFQNGVETDIQLELLNDNESISFWFQEVKKKYNKVE